MNTTIFIATLGAILFAVGVVYSIKAWQTRPILTAEQNAQRIKDQFSPITYPMLVSGIGLVTGLFMLGLAFGPVLIK